MARKRSNQACAASVTIPSTTCHLIKILAPETFDLAAAVSSYGFFMLAPNRWVKADPLVPGSQAVFERPLRMTDDTAVPVRITQTRDGAGSELTVAVQGATALSPTDEEHIQNQVIRVLRLAPSDVEVVAALQAMHAEAKADNFGHMFRSPTLWEDMVKSITLCNCGWSRTISMNAALCAEIGEGAFPTPAQVAAAGAEALQSRCGVGYRGKTIHGLAQQVLDGTVAALGLEQQDLDAAVLYKKLLPLSGMGPFTAANVLQLLGHFERIPADTETARHLKQRHKISGLSPRTLQEAAQKVYEKYAPYQFLVYWFELRQGYEAIFGSLADMDAADYAKATGHIMRAGAAAVASSGAAVTQGPPSPQLAAAVAAESVVASAQAPNEDACEEVVAGAGSASPQGRKRRRAKSSGRTVGGEPCSADVTTEKEWIEGMGNDVRGPATPRQVGSSVRTRSRTKSGSA